MTVFRWLSSGAWVVLVLVLLGGLPAAAQAPGPQPKVVYVPMPGEEDAGVAPAPTQPVTTAVLPNEPPPPTPQAEQQSPDAPSRVITAVPPTPLPPDQLDPTPRTLEPTGPTAMIDGHPREGSFLSGPGSFTFIMHHTLMTGLGVLATQMVPRAIYAVQNADPTQNYFGNEKARIAYLAGGLGGAAVGFAGSAVWQFNHWIGERAANFGIVNSFFGGAFLGGLTDLFTKDPYAITWLTVIGNTAAAWLSIVIGGGDLPLNHGLLVASGGLWAAIYTSLIIAIITTTGGLTNGRVAADAIMITPAIGAAAMALATLKFDPSTAQVMRANIFGLGVGGAVLVIAALVLGANFNNPVPYILGGVGAIGAQTLVSLLWAEAAEPPPVTPISNQPIQQRVSVWW